MAFNQKLKLGVLGGGQLGRMLIQSAIDFNLDVSILDPDEHAPCCILTSNFHIGKLTDYDSVYQFGKNCDVITIEIENVNIEALKALRKEGIKVFPQPEVISLIQNKRIQKQFYKDNGIPTSDFVLTENRSDVEWHKELLPAVNKLGREGYDGRGVQILRNEDDLHRAFDSPGLLERLVDFDKEISVIVARNVSGEITTFPAVELVFHPVHNLVEYLFAPADIDEEIRLKADNIARDLISKLDMVGLLAVEMFVENGEVLVNEMAPRPHNSGHQTIEGNITSQYEQHLRAILDWPLGSTNQIIPAAMVNILGEDGYEGEAIYNGMDKVLKEKGVHVHLYGKKITKPFRKMGHVTVVGDDVQRLKQTIKFIQQNLKIIA